ISIPNTSKSLAILRIVLQDSSRGKRRLICICSGSFPVSSGSHTSLHSLPSRPRTTSDESLLASSFFCLSSYSANVILPVSCQLRPPSLVSIVHTPRSQGQPGRRNTFRSDHGSRQRISD